MRFEVSAPARRLLVAGGGAIRDASPTWPARRFPPSVARQVFPYGACIPRAGGVVVGHLFRRMMVHYGPGRWFDPTRVAPVSRVMPRPGVTVVGKRGQALKGVRWMSGHREATKDAAACDKRRGSGKRESIRRSPNGETPPSRVTPARTHRAGRANAGN